MATMNPFDLLDGDDYNDPSEVLAAAQLKMAEMPKKIAAPVPVQAKAAKLPTKPLPPGQAVKELKNENGRDEAVRGGRGGGTRGGGRSRGFFNRDSNSIEVSTGANNGFPGGYKPSEEGDGRASDRRPNFDRPRGGGFRGGRRGGLSNGESGEGERPRRVFERRSGTGRGNEVKREGSGRGNWGTSADENTPGAEEPVVDAEKDANVVKAAEEEAADAVKDNPEGEKEPEPEEKEMTLEEYEKVLEEKRKALHALKAKERKVEVDKDLKSMQALMCKKSNDEIFIKLGSEKDKKKDGADKDEKAKKSVSINEFLKPAEGESFYGSGGRRRGRGGVSRGAFGGYNRDAAAPKIEDRGQFPSLGGK